MKYEWTITSRETTIHVTLLADYVPALFFGLIDRLGTKNERDADQKDFNQLKSDLLYSYMAGTLK